MLGPKDPVPLPLGGGWWLEPATETEIVEDLAHGFDGAASPTLWRGSCLKGAVLTCLDRWSYWSNPDYHQN